MTEEQDQTEKEIFTYLKNEVKIHDSYAAKLASYLCREIKFGEVDDVARMEPTEWKKAFTHTELAPSAKRKLLEKMNEVRENKKRNLLDIENIINEEPSCGTFQSLYMTIYFCIVTLLFFFWTKARKEI
ncbi:hypothetical protein RFI_05106 [Reticulomyxa filosa]|uniref:Uncharacterized protein n=1 Tax=Reticulomyxa filosa TaxID=46433 RepID=X6NZ27_RETFI|nr:hypothetical protein RFI_05562 [Reticulomyxa filosa]ETO32011.1 hypothetical protein RFI_05106 [Reticulomyxa filosa]|eukprot:ETO31560.1 hypothetical protein RFI_05562 [Reticulomyxa filosa]